MNRPMQNASSKKAGETWCHLWRHESILKKSLHAWLGIWVLANSVWACLRSCRGFGSWVAHWNQCALFWGVVNTQVVTFVLEPKCFEMDEILNLWRMTSIRCHGMHGHLDVVAVCALVKNVAVHPCIDMLAYSLMASCFVHASLEMEQP